MLKFDHFWKKFTTNCNTDLKTIIHENEQKCQLKLYFSPTNYSKFQVLLMKFHIFKFHYKYVKIEGNFPTVKVLKKNIPCQTSPHSHYILIYSKINNNIKAKLKTELNSKNITHNKLYIDFCNIFINNIFKCTINCTWLKN